MAVACDACQQPVNEQASQCPHCGARLRTAAPGVALSREEARALLAIDDRSSDGLLATLEELLSHYRRRSAAYAAQSELASAGLISLLVGPMAVFCLMVIGVPGVIAGALVAAMVIGLLARAAIRRHVGEKRSRALSQLDTPAEPPAPLPVAVVRTAPPPSSPGKLAPLAGASPEPAVRADGEPGAEPRLLR